MIVRKNKLKKSIRENTLALGTDVSLPSPQIIDLLGYAGLDFAVIDTEHLGATPNDMIGIENMVRAAELYDITPLVKVEKNDYMTISHALDAGAQGLVVPHVRTKEDAQRMVQAALFPPLGKRGIGHQRGQYGVDAVVLNEIIEKSNDEIVLIPIIEEKEGYENLEDILTVRSIDAVWLGPGDLALDLGLPQGHPKIFEYIERARSVCKTNKVPYLEGGSDAQKIAEQAIRGARLMILGVDVFLLSQAYSNLVKAARTAIPTGTSDLSHERIV